MGKVINTTSDNLKKYKADQIRKMRYLVVDTVKDIEVEATRKAPQFVAVESEFRNNDLTGEVGVWGENNLAAYFEFGTGLSAREILAPYPEWIREIAWKFKRPEDGTLKGKPYLYPSVLKNTEIFNKKLDEIVKEKTKDNG